MLIATHENPHYPTPYPVGIAVIQWHTDDGLCTYVIYPIKDGNERYVEVEIAFGSDDLETIKPPLKTWQPLKNAFADDSEDYPCEDETVQDLYDVWDDGAVRRPEAAQRLFKKYKPLIDAYTEDANQFLNKQAAQEYDKKFHVAKANGWDTTLVEQSEQMAFPYEA